MASMIVIPYASYGYVKCIKAKPKSFSMPIHLRSDKKKALLFYEVRNIEDIYTFYTHKFFRKYQPYFNAQGYAICLPFNTQSPYSDNLYPVKYNHAYYYKKGKVYIYNLTHSDIWKKTTSSDLLKRFNKTPTQSS